MGKSPCADDPHGDEKKGPWTPDEDRKLVDYIEKHGHGSWRALPKLAGLNRSGKSCRLRWSNYLRPDIKRGKFSEEEEQLIVYLHSILGNKWSAIATRIPGRTDNEIKNFWNTHLKKKLIQKGIDPMTHQPITNGLSGIIRNFESVMEIFNTGGSSLFEDANGLSVWEKHILENQLEYRAAINRGDLEICRALLLETKEARNATLCGRTKGLIFSKVMKSLVEDKRGKAYDYSKNLKWVSNVLESGAVGEGGNGDEDKSVKTRVLATSSSVVVEEKSLNDLINGFFNEVDFLELNSRKDEVLQVYQEEKVKLAQLLNELSCRFSLQIDWVVDLRGTSRIMKVHYIDDRWERQKKIINIGLSNYYSKSNYDIVVKAIKQSCGDLNIDMNMCSVVFAGDVNDRDDSSDNSWFSPRNSLAFAGFLPDIGELLGCDIFGKLVQSNIFDALLTSVTKPIIDPIRQCLIYVHQTASKVKFISARNKVNFMCKRAFSKDDLERCCSGFQCLEIALGLKEEFYELEKTDPDYVPINLTAEKWDEATATFQHLKALFDDVCSFSNGRKCDILDLSPIKNFPKLIYMHKVLVTGCTQSKYCLVCRDASHEIQNFLDLYWRKLCLVSIIQIVLDPRFKMDTVKLWYQELYGSAADEYFEKINKEFRAVYDEYARENFSKSYKRMLDSLQMPCGSSKTELALYLEDLKVPAIKKFDILAWWRGNAPFYPTLAKMARDYLAVPVFHAPAISSTLTSEIQTSLDLQHFKVEGEVLQAVLCLRDWSPARVVLDTTSKGDVSTNCSTNCNQLRQRQQQMQPAGLPQPQSLTGGRELQHFTGKQADEDEEDLPITESNNFVYR